MKSLLNRCSKLDFAKLLEINGGYASSSGLVPNEQFSRIDGSYSLTSSFTPRLLRYISDGTWYMVGDPKSDPYYHQDPDLFIQYVYYNKLSFTDYWMDFDNCKLNFIHKINFSENTEIKDPSLITDGNIVASGSCGAGAFYNCEPKEYINPSCINNTNYKRYGTLTYSKPSWM